MDFGSASNFEQAPTGIHKARLFSIVDLGTQKGEYKGEPTKNRQLHFTWELVDEFKEDGKPYVISNFYNQSLGEKAKFILDMTSWFGKAPVIPNDPSEKSAFVLDLLKSLMGKGCQLVIVDKEGKHKISTVTGLGKTDKVEGDTVNEQIFFDLDNFDEDVFEKISKGLKGFIERSPEYAKIMNPDSADEQPAREEEIPF